jgi:hypothetical protein
MAARSQNVPAPSPSSRLWNSRFSRTLHRDPNDLYDDEDDLQAYPLPATLREYEELYFGLARSQLTDNQSIAVSRYEQCSLCDLLSVSLPHHVHLI